MLTGKMIEKQLVLSLGSFLSRKPKRRVLESLAGPRQLGVSIVGLAWS
jgi:hypothetical protein